MARIADRVRLTLLNVRSDSAVDTGSVANIVSIENIVGNAALSQKVRAAIAVSGRSGVGVRDNRPFQIVNSASACLSVELRRFSYFSKAGFTSNHSTEATRFGTRRLRAKLSCWCRPKRASKSFVIK